MPKDRKLLLGFLAIARILLSRLFLMKSLKWVMVRENNI